MAGINCTKLHAFVWIIVPNIARNVKWHSNTSYSRTVLELYESSCFQCSEGLVHVCWLNTRRLVMIQHWTERNLSYPKQSTSTLLLLLLLLFMSLVTDLFLVLFITLKQRRFSPFRLQNSRLYYFLYYVRISKYSWCL